MENVITMNEKGVYRKDIESDKMRQKMVNEYNQVDKDGFTKIEKLFNEEMPF